jgi:antitoxin MazE
MRARIAKWGNSLAVRLPRAMAEEAGFKAGQAVEVSLTAEAGLEIKTVNAVHHYELSELLAEVERLGPENRPKFEDWGILPSEWPQEDWSDIAPTDEEMGIENGPDRRPRRRRR